MTKSESRRLSILSAGEINEIFGLPNFSDDERHLFFELSTIEREVINAIRTISVAVNLILQLGYFKSRRMFFVYELSEIEPDLRYVMRLYFPDLSWEIVKPISKPTRLEQQRTILKLFGYAFCDGTKKIELEQKAARVAAISTQPLYILRELLQYLEMQCWIAPGYTFLQDMVSRVVTGERKRITAVLQHTLSQTVTLRLDELLDADEGMFRISALKHEAKDFSYSLMLPMRCITAKMYPFP